MTSPRSDLVARLRHEITAMTGDSVLVVQTVVAADPAPRRWWRSAPASPSPDHFLVQLAGGPDGTLAVLLAGSTVVGGPHDVPRSVHQAVLEAGWSEPGDPGHPSQTGGDYGRWARLGDPASLDALAESVVAGLELVGARPEQEWSFDRVQ